MRTIALLLLVSASVTLARQQYQLLRKRRTKETGVRRRNAFKASDDADALRLFEEATRQHRFDQAMSLPTAPTSGPSPPPLDGPSPPPEGPPLPGGPKGGKCTKSNNIT